MIVSRHATSERFRWLQVSALVLTLCAVGAVWLYNPVAFVSEDCYFYPVIARNIAIDASQSFWGGESTNGVHPLWLYLLSGYTYLAIWFKPTMAADAAYAVPLVVGLLAIGTYEWRRALEIAGLPAGPALLLPLLYLSVLGLLYSEAHCYFAVLGIAARLAVAERAHAKGRPIRLGLALAAVLLTRLDAIFVVGARQSGNNGCADNRSLPEHLTASCFGSKPRARRSRTA